MKKENKDKPLVFKVILEGGRYYFKIFPVFAILLSIINAFFGTLHGFSTFMTQIFYDSISEVITENVSINKVYVLIILLGLIFVLREIMSGIQNFILDTMKKKADGEMSTIIHKKLGRLDPICFESVKFQDDFNKAIEGSKIVVDIINLIVTTFTFYVPYIVFMWLYLYYLKPTFVFLVVLVFVPVLFSQIIRTNIIAKFEDNVAPLRREYSFCIRAIIDKEYYKETRNIGAYSFFLKRLLCVMNRMKNVEIIANRRINRLELLISLLSIGGYIGILYMLVTALLVGDITVGAFAAVFNSIGLVFAIMKELINNDIGNISANIGRAHNFIRFMEMPEVGGEEYEPVYEKGIKVENVSFTYPNSTSRSVKNVSVEIKAGETVAIVGENGAGKTTLVRLMIGLYTPNEGKVIVNGMDTQKVSKKSVFKGISGVFQRYQRYQMTLQENIEISDVERGKVSDDAIEYAMKQGGININSKKYPDGYATMLSREFGGIDLSGGEWQRVAIARGIYRVHNVIVLDEPTAAIDPIEESRIFNKFVKLSQNKTAVIVTHRIGSAKIANRIIVMNEGNIIDVGTHDELMERGGLYSEMFFAQSSWFKSSTY